MAHIRNGWKSIGWLLPWVIAVPVWAHTVKVSGDVAATFHIEPQHNPQAGKPSRTWFALTRKGGQTIPLSQCNCQLSVYSIPRSKGTAPMLRPTLKTVNAERYQGVPGAEITFPKAGQYELLLSGSPKAPASFKPFTLTYKVVVGGRR